MASSLVKDLKSLYLPAKVNPAKILQSMKVKHAARISADLQRLATEYTDNLKTLDSISKEIKGWTASTMEAATCALNLLATSLQQQSSKLMEGIQAIRTASQGATSVKMKDVRAESATRERAIRPYVQSGTPAALAKWLFNEGGIKEAESGTEVNNKWQVNMPMDIDEGDFFVGRPAAWSTDTSADKFGACVRKVILAYGPRLAEASKKLSDSLQKQVRSGMGSKCAVLRVAPKGGGQDTVESLSSWAPKSWLDKHIPPEGLSKFGSPWIVCGLSGSCRFGPNGWPTPGMGQFLVQVKGDALLVTFPYSASFECGASMKDTEAWLMGLAPLNFNHVAKTSFRAAKLVEGTVLWIPYGWVPVMVNCAAQPELPMTLVIPYLSAKLALRFTSIGMLVNFQFYNVTANKHAGGQMWKEHGDSYLEWLSCLKQQEATLPAIEDTQCEEPGVHAIMDGKLDHQSEAKEQEEEEANGL